MFKVGDRVRIRDWDDMKKEYGKDCDGNIKVPNQIFSRNMRHLCGRYATIKDIDKYDVIELGDWSNATGDVYWWFNKDMLELAETVREEKDMNKVLELYCEKAERRIEHDYDEIVEEERNENPFVKKYNELVNEFEAKMDDLYKREIDENGNHHVFVNNAYKYTYPFSIDITFTNENIKHYKEAKETELQDLDDFKQEVSAKLSLSDDLDYTLKVLKEYGIINKKTGKLESYFTELDEQNEV